MVDSKSTMHNEINKAWKSTCKVLLGDEIGELKDYEPWLAEFYYDPRVEKSAVSGKEVYLAIDDYCKDAKFISFDEVDFSKKFEQLNINEIKDIDSIIGALQERFYYTGNIIIGNSKFVEKSTGIGDSFYVYNSAQIDESQYVAYTKWYRYGKHIFGVNNGSASEHCIKGHLPTKSQRCFDIYVAGFSSDAYYSADILNCSDVMFCFNLQGVRRAIGNLELAGDKYVALKKKLTSEMVSELKSKKRLPSLFELMSGFKRQELGFNAKEEEPFDIKPVEEAFRKTYKIILKKEPNKLESYRGYMFKHGPRMEMLSGTSSKGDIVVPSLSIFEKMPINKSRLICISDSFALAEKKPTLTADEVQNLSMHDVSSLSKIAFISFDIISGKNRNVGKTVYYIDSSDCYAGFGYREAKLSAFTYWPRQSEHIFGSAMALSSAFCISTYFSKKMTRSFEVDACDSCSDIYYSHNCENVRDAMFCFNVKNMNHAIGNAELPLDKYSKVKDSVVEQIADELTSKKDLRWDIFNIGCGQQ
jgi:hypothetical protein